ncbi:MAG: integrase family protein [Zoogloea sp.]|nr:integrase family protein [Zoogloea sp.]
MTFSARDAKLLQPGQHLTLDEQPGLRLEATEKFRTWVYRYKSPVDGRMRQVKIGRWPEMSFHAAVVEWESLRRRRDAGEDVSAMRRVVRQEAREVAARAQEEAQAATYTVRVLCDDYLAGHIDVHRAQKGRTEVRRLFEKYLGDFAFVPAASVTRAQAFDLIHGIAKATPVLAGQLRTELGGAWDYAIDSGRMTDSAPNWWRLILRGKIKSKGKKIAGEHVGTAKRVLSEEEVATLIRWLPNFTSIVSDALTLYLWAGVRGAEIVAMEGNEVVREADGWWWTIPKAKTKNARHDGATDLRVPLVGRALDVVLRRKERYGDGWLFPKRARAGHVEQKTIQARVFYQQPYSQTRPQDVRPRLTVTHWAPHDLRRTARTLLARLGCPDEIGEALIGHMKPGVLGTYNRHSYDGERREWLRKLADHLEVLSART